MKYFYSIIQKIVELKNVNNSNLGKIFIFHQIVEGKPNNIYQVSLDSFKKFINLLNDIGKIKDLRQLSDEGSNNDFYITFDDVHYNAYQNAMLWLIESGIPFTVFITCYFINKNNYISLKELKYLSKNNLCTIGSHSITHPILRKLNSIGIYNEIINSKIILKKLIEKDIDFFAYPYGTKYACSNIAKKITKNAGYKFAFSTYNMGITKKIIKKTPYFIPRINVDEKFIMSMVNKYEFS